MQKAGAEAKSQWIAQDTRKRVTAAVLVTAYHIVAPTCEDEAVRHTHGHAGGWRLSTSFGYCTMVPLPVTSLALQ